MTKSWKMSAQPDIEIAKRYNMFPYVNNVDSFVFLKFSVILRYDLHQNSKLPP